MVFKSLSSLHSLHRQLFSRALRRNPHFRSASHARHQPARITDGPLQHTADAAAKGKQQYIPRPPLRNLFPRIVFPNPQTLPALIILSSRHRSLLRSAIANANLTVAERALAHRIVASSSPAAAYAFAHLPNSQQRRGYATSAPDAHTTVILTQATRDQVWRTIFHPHTPTAPSARNVPKASSDKTSPTEAYAQYRRKQAFKDLAASASAATAAEKARTSEIVKKRPATPKSASSVVSQNGTLDEVLVPETRSVAAASPATSAFTFEEDAASVMSLESIPDMEASAETSTTVTKTAVSKIETEANERLRELDAVIAGENLLSTTQSKATSSSASPSEVTKKQKDSEMLEEVREFLRFVNGLIDENRGFGTGRL